MRHLQPDFQLRLSHHKVETQHLMLIAYGDFEVMQNVAVYGTLGFGVARTESSGWQGNASRQYLSNTETQLVDGVGASYKVIENLNLDLGYRYVDLSKADSGLNNVTNAHNLQDE